MARAWIRRLLALSAFTFSATCARVTNSNKVPKQAALLSQVNSLTLRAGRQTASRRVSPVPQLQCVGPSDVCELYEVDVMRCTNEGSDYDKENIQWSCKASLPEEFKLGATDVSCEGYESSDDPYILKGSCGVEYNLFLTEKGEARYAQKVQEPLIQEPSFRVKSPDTETYAGIIFMVVFVAVACIILYGLCMACLTPSGGQNPGRQGRGGGGGGFDDSDPPPPYDAQPPRSPRKPPQQKKTRASSSRSNAESQQQQGWRPGFWTGAATGAAAGAYMAGGRQQTQPETTERRPPVGLFGGGGTGTRPPPTSPPSGYTDSTPSYSSSRHESTGFGSTSRR